MADPETPDRPFHWRMIRRILRVPVVIFVWLWFLIDETLVAAFRPLVRYLLAFQVMQRAEQWISRQDRWASLVILAIPLILIEPPKIFAVLLIAAGQVKVGTILLIASYLVGLVAVERVFHITKPKLMTIGWFAACYRVWERVRGWAMGIVTRSRAWAFLTEELAALKTVLRRLAGEIGRRGLKARIWLRRLARRG